MLERPLPVVRPLIAALAALAMSACEAGSPAAPAPTPGGAEEVVSLEVSCPSRLLIGERAPCLALERYRSGRVAPVIFESTWSSARPDVVTVDAQGTVHGRSAGQARVSGAYSGREGFATIVVTAEDALRIRAAADQGEFRTGATVTMWLQGYYSVASADTARLSLRITDQTGIVATSTPVTVARGGDFFLLSSTFVVPPLSTRVCRAAVLEVGSATILEPQSNETVLFCLPIRQ